MSVADLIPKDIGAQVGRRRMKKKIASAVNYLYIIYVVVAELAFRIQ